MALEIRPAAPADLDDVRFIGFSTWPPTYGPIRGSSFVVKGLDDWWSPQALAYSLENGFIFLALDGSTPVGVAEYGFLEQGVVLWKLYVLPSHQGTGVGSRLLEQVGKIAYERSSDLITECEARNERAIAFYSAKGFQQTGRETSKFGDAIWWRRPHRELDS